MDAINIHIIGDSVNQPFVIRIFNALISKLFHSHLNWFSSRLKMLTPFQHAAVVAC